jgi:hypothetical protein
MDEQELRRSGLPDWAIEILQTLTEEERSAFRSYFIDDADGSAIDELIKPGSRDRLKKATYAALTLFRHHRLRSGSAIPVAAVPIENLVILCDDHHRPEQATFPRLWSLFPFLLPHTVRVEAYEPSH